MSGKLYQVQNGQKVDVTPRVAALTDVSSKADISLGNVNSTGQAAMAHAAMPSEQYIDLTLPANGGTVTAPADGYIHLNKWSSTAGEYCALQNWTAHFSTAAVTSRTVTDTIELYIPVTKNDVVQVGYNAAGQTNAFRFIYANGSAPQP